MKKKYALVFFSLLLIAAILWLFWPLTSDEFKINWDENKIAEKQKFLSRQPLDSIKEDKPNILLIIVDDLGKTDITLYGNGKVNTPHIDRLGREGVVFDQAYVASPVCSPSRAAIFTGRYPQRYGFTYQMHEFYPDNRAMYYGFKYFVDSYPWLTRDLVKVPSREMAEKQGLPPSEITIAELLKREGYRTGLVGKWHLGSHKRIVPCNFGFDYQYGFYASHSLYARESNPDIISLKNPDDFSDKHIWSGQRDGPHAIYRNCEEVEEDTYLTDAITRECRQFISENRTRPFFLVASYNAPHTPLQAPESYVRLFDHVEDPVKRIYYAMIKSLDDNIGKLIEILRYYKLEKNTLIFFISDNGAATYTHATDNDPLKGGKITDFEGGLNVPFIMKWPGQVRAGVEYTKPVIAMDIFGTVVSVLDIELPQDRILDGVNLIPHVKGAIKNNIPHDYLFWYRGASRAIRNQDYKLIYNVMMKDTVLFNMKNDNLEDLNIYPEKKKVALRMIKSYNEWLQSLPSPLWPPLVYYVHEEEGEKYYFDN